MEIPNKGELQQIALNHSSDVAFGDFLNLYKKCTAKPHSFLKSNTTLVSYNILHLGKTLHKNRSYKK